jgi:hypothetical protein
MHSFSYAAACAGQSLSTRFLGTEINKPLFLTAFYCDQENVYRRISLSFIKLSH